MLVFYNSSLIIGLQIINCDKENHFNFKYTQYSKLVFWFTHWQNVLLKTVLKAAVFWKFCKICKKISITEFTVKEVTVCTVATFLNEVLGQIFFLRNFQTIHRNKQYKSGLPNVILIRNNKFRWFKLWYR